MNPSISLAIVGAGAIAKHHFASAQTNGIPVKYIVDTQLDRAQALAAGAKTEGAASAQTTTATDDLTQALGDDSVRGIVIAIPNQFHCPVAVQALEAGKDILLEKPMGLNLEECDRINETAARHDRFVQVGLVHRYSSVAGCAKKLIDEGKLGEVYHAKVSLYRRRGIPGLGGWFTTKAVSGGGVLIDLGVHVIDLALFLMNFPKSKQIMGATYNKFGSRMEDYVYESMWAGPPKYDGVCDVDDSAHAMMRFENGSTLELNATWAGNFPNGSMPESMVGLFGDRGGLTFDLDGDHVNMASEECGYNVDKRFTLKKENAFELQLADFVRGIESRNVGGATGIQAAEVQRIIDEIYRSSEA